MRQFVTFVLGLFFCTPAAAVDAQFMVAASASRPLTTDTGSVTDRIDLGAFANKMWLPGNTVLSFYYLGPGFQVTNGWWTSLRGGVALNWPEIGDAVPAISLWNFFNTPEGTLTLFTETEVYPLPGGGLDYYGVYCADYNFEFMNLGLHGEQVNLGITAGPHVGFTLTEHLSTNVQYHWDFADAHALRAIVSLNL